VDAAEEIVNIIANAPVRTCTYVNPNAISAGAILALATDEIYMAPGSKIGDAMPLMMSPVGSAEAMPEGMEEKMTSYVAGLIRATAQRKGHDARLAEAMVRRTVGYTIGEDVICPTNQILTLTNVEAERVVERDGEKGPLLSKGTVRDRAELLNRLGLAAATVRELRVSPAERIARYIEMMSALLLIGGVLGLYIEFKTPGFGLPGILGLTLLAVWFWGHHVAGLAGMGEILLFLLGVALLAVEVFLLPGFGMAGTAGALMIFASLFLAMVERYPGGPWYASPRSLQGAVIVLGASTFAVMLAAALLARVLPSTSLYRNLILGAAVDARQGYQVRQETTALVGMKGLAVTALRPGGIAAFGERRMDVVTRGEFVAKGARIVVAEAHGGRVVVEEVRGTA
jgi:membrane-bound serine protease (ClpP class)